MIVLYSGRPGSGKSYHSLKRIRRALKKGRDVIANFEVNCDDNWKGRFTYLPNSSVTAGNLVAIASDYWNSHQFKEDGLLAVFDEAQLLWNSRNWKDSDRMSFLEFMSQHRKYGYEILLIAQADIMIDKQFRTLIEFECNHKKVASFGALAKFMRICAGGELFYAKTTYYQQNLKVDGEWIRYSPKIARMYDSYKTFDKAQALGALAPPPALTDGFGESDDVQITKSSVFQS